MPWIGTYVLNSAGRPVPEPDAIAWARWYETAAELRRVGLDALGPLGEVSTVFLGLDHNFSSRPEDDPLGHRPILWETLVFNGPLDGEMRRYSSREDAEQGHAEMVMRCLTTGVRT